MDREIQNLGQLNGEVLLFGGVYSNLQSLEAIIAFAKARNIPPSHCICTGDIVGYCAQPEETLQLFKKWGAHSIKGNVEEQLINGSQNCGCDFKSGSRCEEFSQTWYPYAQSLVSQKSIEFLKTIPDHITFDLAGKKVGVVHGSTSNISEFIFKSTSWKDKELNFSDLECEVIIAGHSGLPFKDLHEGKIWVNPGVIGMPANDGNTETWFTILKDQPRIQFEFHTLKYDHNTAKNLMIDASLPNEYAQTLLTGIWDNTEILPDAEKQLQGDPIEL